MSFVRGLVAVVRRLWFVPNLHWDEMLWELNQILAEELDFRYEAASTQRMRENLRKHAIYVPKVFLHIRRGGYLLQDHRASAHGRLHSYAAHRPDAHVKAWCHANNFNMRKVGRRLYNSMWRQMLEDNLFHGDMHPGNIILLHNSRIALIDFGSTGALKHGVRRSIRC